jgi:translation elongation factor EF-Ts
LEQPFVKDGSVTISKYLANKGKEFGATLEAKSFALFILGETQAESEGSEEG